jgi:hypothetical protein
MAIQFHYHKWAMVTSKPLPYWFLELNPDGTARMGELTESAPAAEFEGVVADPLKAGILSEMDRLASNPPPICGGHFDTFVVVDVRRDFASIACLPMRAGSPLEALYGLVQQAVKSTEWRRHPR